MTVPLLSVSITNYNYAKFISRSIESVLKQSFKDFELIIVDNASTDDSVNVIRSYADQDDRIRLLINSENKGLAYSLARAAEEARGEYRVHIDADDWVIDERAFELQIEMLQQHPNLSFVFSPIVLFDDQDNPTVLPPPGYTQNKIMPGTEAIKDALMVRVVHSGPMMRVSAFRAMGGYDTSYMSAIDIKLAMDLCGQGDVGYIHRPLYAFYQHDGSMGDASSVKKKQLDMVRAVESVFQGPLRDRLSPELRREALGHILTLHATQAIFNNHNALGWRALLSGFRLNPLIVLLKGRLPSLAVRALLGEQGYRLIASRLPRRHKQST